MHRCFIDKSFIDAFKLSTTQSLPKEVAHRLIKVVRIKPSEEFGLFDGQGRQIIAKLDAKSLSLHDARLIEQSPPKPGLTLLQAVIEETKLTQTLKRGTEFGIDHFVIFSGEFSEPFLLEKLMKREQRFLNVLIDAARQSGRLFVPSLVFAKDLSAALENITGAYWGIFGNITAEKLLSCALKEKGT
ncbi:MAG TPA: RsmE family RNA methyltransferase, partial [Myxococcota bacterium]|nr:RsmE family RNA methyltransferase [Myxococcota bacterium]